MENSKYQYEGMKWLAEMELVNHPQLINTIKFNVMMVSRSIREVELLIYRENKQMLVQVELSWFGRKFKRKQIFSEVHEALQILLPTFKFRVTDNPEIMKLAIAQIQKALTGGPSEKISNGGNTSIQQPDPTTQSAAPKIGDGVDKDRVSDQKESSETSTEVRSESSETDTKKE